MKDDHQFESDTGILFKFSEEPSSVSDKKVTNIIIHGIPVSCDAVIGSLQVDLPSFILFNTNLNERPPAKEVAEPISNYVLGRFGFRNEDDNAALSDSQKPNQGEVIGFI